MDNVIRFVILMTVILQFAACAPLKKSGSNNSKPQDLSEFSLAARDDSHYQAMIGFLKTQNYSNAMIEAKSVLIRFPNDVLTKCAVQVASIFLLGPASAENVILERMNADSDKVDLLTFYRHKLVSGELSTAMIALDCSFWPHGAPILEPYIGEEQGQVWLRLHVFYSGANWIFAKSITVVADGTRFDKDGLDFSKTADGDSVLEQGEWQASDRDIHMLTAIASSSNATIRIRGERNYTDYDFTATDRLVIKDVLLAYWKLGAQILANEENKR